MAKLDNISKGIAIGVGLALLIPAAAVVLGPAFKPLARGAFKAGIRTAERGRELLAEAVEHLEDLVSETRSEMQAEFMSPSAAKDSDSAGDTGSGEESGAETESGAGHPDNVTPMKEASER